MSRSESSSDAGVDVFDDAVSFEHVSTERMPFLHWLQLLHDDTEHKYWDLAHLVLSGGPDGMWINRFDLNPHLVLEDVRLSYAAGRSSVTAKHLDLARTMVDLYYDDAPAVAELVLQRKTRESDLTEGHGARAVGGAVDDALRERNLTRALPGSRAGRDALIPNVTDSNGNDVALTESSAPHLIVRSRCNKLRDNGLRCINFTVPGQDVCTAHGGRIYTAEELRNLHQITKEKLLAAGERAVDNLVSLLNSTNDMVRLKASEAILDRTGFAPGIEISVVSTPQGDRTPAQIIADRLARLAGETPTIERVNDDNSSSNGHTDDSATTDDDDDSTPPEEIVDAETVEEARTS
jgi:hypothetical protein